nr:hypothetical protein [uncultured bacterium]
MDSGPDVGRSGFCGFGVYLTSAERGPGDLVSGFVFDVEFTPPNGNLPRSLEAELHPVAANSQNDDRDLFVDPDFLPRLAR